MRSGFPNAARCAVLLAVLIGAAFCAGSAPGQLTDEEKKALFLKARQDIRPVPRASATPRPRPKPTVAPKSTPQPTPKPTPQPTSEPAPETSPDAPDAPDTGRDEGEPARGSPIPPKPRPTPVGDGDDIIPLEKELPKPKPTATPRPEARATPRASDQGTTGTTNRIQRPDAPIVIEKSGLSDESGYQPPKSSGGGWFKRYRYLTPDVRRAIDRAPVLKGRWRYIVIHNSGTRQGNARIFDNYHRRVRKMQNGLAYHFVIGNGRSSGDGQVEIGSRWTRQINGGHVASDYLNNIALGICLVGDFNRDRPTPDQLAALAELVDYLRGRVGKYKGAPVAVRGHKQINPKPTDCPGDRFDLKWLRKRFGY